jgi:hypothetical protein
VQKAVERAKHRANNFSKGVVLPKVDSKLMNNPYYNTIRTTASSPSQQNKAKVVPGTK